MNKNNKKRIIVFASGSGTNFINIYKNLNTQNINGEIILLISNNKNCGAIKFAKDENIDFKIINIFRYKTDENILNKYKVLLDIYKPDLILLAGFMKKIPIEIVEMYKNKILNIHPSLLPKYGGKGFYGMNVHRAVLESKDRITGVTVHFIDNEYDRGPILIQEKVEVRPNDSLESLSNRVLQTEYQVYFKAVELFCNNLIRIKGDKIFINEKN